MAQLTKAELEKKAKLFRKALRKKGIPLKNIHFYLAGGFVPTIQVTSKEFLGWSYGRALTYRLYRRFSNIDLKSAMKHYKTKPKTKSKK